MLELSEGGIMSSQEMGTWLWKQLMLRNLLFHRNMVLSVGNFQQCHGQEKCSQSGTAALGMQPFQSVLNEGLGK